MGFIKRGKHAMPKGDEHQEQEQPKRAKKAQDMMSAHIKETVLEASLQSFAENKAFIVERDGKRLFVGMLVKGDDIGGFDRKSLRDEAKGGIIEAIDSGAIKIYASEDMLSDEVFIIIPDAVTISNMDEYTMLTEAPYTVAFVDETGVVEDSEVSVDYATFANVVEGSVDIMDVLADLGFDFAKTDEDVPETQVTSVMEPVGDVPPVDEAADETEDEFDLDEPMTGEEAANFDDDDISDDFEDELPVDEYGDDNFSVTGDGAGAEPIDIDAMIESGDTSVEVEDDDDDEEFDTVVSDERYNEAIARTFYSDDLGLEVTTAPFDSQFMHQNPYVPFEENREKGWLNDYLNEMSRDANLDMKKLHQDNLFRMRKEYYNLISMHCAKIRDETDPENPNSQYHLIKKGILDAYDQKESNLDRTVSERKDKVENAWNDMLEKVGKNAADKAKAHYVERYGAQHQHELFAIEPSVKSEMDSKMRDGLREMNAQRRSDALTRLDEGINQILVDVSERYMKCLEQETAHYKEWRERINAFIDEHRKDDIAHDKALAEELAQSEKADRVLAEYTEKLNAQTADFQARSDAMRQDVERIKQENAEAIAKLKEDNAERVAQLNDEKSILQNRIDELIKKYAELDEKKAGEYESRVQTLKDENAAADIRYEQLVKTNRRSAIISVGLAIVAVIAACAIGILIGSGLNLEFGSKKVSDEVVQEFNDRMDRVDKSGQTSGTEENK